MNKVINNISKNLPIYISVVMVVVNALIDAGYLTIPQTYTGIINVVLTAFGVGVLHVRQRASLK